MGKTIQIKNTLDIRKIVMKVRNKLLEKDIDIGDGDNNVITPVVEVISTDEQILKLIVEKLVDKFNESNK